MTGLNVAAGLGAADHVFDKTDLTLFMFPACYSAVCLLSDMYKPGISLYTEFRTKSLQLNLTV